MKNFSNKRKCDHKESRRLALVVTQNSQYKETHEYKKIIKEYEGYVIKVKLYPLNMSFNKLRSDINFYKKENGFSEKQGDKIIFLKDMLHKEEDNSLKIKKH
ncbi:hypothetical protein [uncultured Eubacterium sp.]|uniref:hypothetical protein n=1 Tax=uncultured Eubacterium sp. TaxID=165185 RepID=UPI0025998208|nr:hypothetical protein [uncultured Eubacterium sp.]